VVTNAMRILASITASWRHHTAGNSISDSRPLLYLKLLTHRVSDPPQICVDSGPNPPIRSPSATPQLPDLGSTVVAIQNESYRLKDKRRAGLLKAAAAGHGKP